MDHIYHMAVSIHTQWIMATRTLGYTGYLAINNMVDTMRCVG